MFIESLTFLLSIVVICKCIVKCIEIVYQQKDFSCDCENCLMKDECDKANSN